MKDFLIGVGIGFAVGAIMCKTCKPVAEAVQKGKKLIEEKVEEGNELVQDKMNNSKPKTQSTKTSKSK